MNAEKQENSFMDYSDFGFPGTELGNLTNVTILMDNLSEVVETKLCSFGGFQVGKS